MGSRQTGRTPKRKRLEKMDSLMSMNSENMSGHEKEIVDRFRNCTGPAAYLVNREGNAGPKAPCGFCGKETSWYCFGCHQNFCTTTKINENVRSHDGNTSEQVPQIVRSTHHMHDPSRSSKTKGVFMRNTCWLHIHKAALEKTSVTPNNNE